MDYPLADFSLTDRSGKTVTKADLLGKVWIASFVLMRCPDGKCPQVTQTLERLQSELKLSSHKDLRFVTFTIDPDHDTPDELDRYAKTFHADPNHWLFLSGSEEVIDKLMRLAYLRAGEEGKKTKEHALRLIVVDRQGNMRGSYLGLKPMSSDSEADEEFYQADLRQLRKQVKTLLQPPLPAFMPADVPRFNAILNGTSGCLIVLGFIFIRKRLVRLHMICMLSALTVSAVFLASYLYYHLIIKGGQSTRFSEQAPDAPSWVGVLYYTILISHITLAVPTVGMALISAYLGLKNRIHSHMRLAKWTFPIWLYVSVTGVVVYWMLYRLYPGP